MNHLSQTGCVGVKHAALMRNRTLNVGTANTLVHTLALLAASLYDAHGPVQQSYPKRCPAVKSLRYI